jgi:protein-tyrosine phosphatase
MAYPSRAYRNPLPQLLSFLTSRHGTNWKIFEFRAEGTGYRDGEVEGRIEHWPWPDHHPPPFAVLPGLIPSLQAWLGEVADKGDGDAANGRVAVLHCKAGKGRSGTVACSYLIAVQGWTVESALERFTQRRMRAGFGDGVSIKSQRRWISYVNRWAADGRRYDERVEGPRVCARVVEVRLWGRRDNVRTAIRGFTEGGKKIEVFHEWSEKDGDILQLDEEDGVLKGWSKSNESLPLSGMNTPKNGGAQMITDGNIIKSPPRVKSPDSMSSAATAYLTNAPPPTLTILRPNKPILMPTWDINVEVEKRNRNFTSMVTSTAHSWFNAYFEGNGPENHGKPERSGIYTIEWDAMDGLKGSSRRGVRAVEKVAVVWRLVDEDEAEDADRERKEKEEIEAIRKSSEEREKEKKREEQREEIRKKMEGDSDSDEEGVQPYGVEGEKV